jgi:hypothetical protein
MSSGIFHPDHNVVLTVWAGGTLPLSADLGAIMDFIGDLQIKLKTAFAISKVDE